MKHGYAVYAEADLPADRRSRLSANSAFADLYYVLYLGRTQRPSALLVTNLTRFPIRGRRASDLVQFGDTHFTLVVTPRGSLGGTFFQLLPWIIAAVGVVLAIAAALLTDRLVRRRQRAEQLAERLDRIAAENRQLYAEQRSIADTLQRALLPETLPEVSGLQTGARYVPGTTGVAIGGDWYDLIVQRDGQRAVGGRRRRRTRPPGGEDDGLTAVRRPRVRGRGGQPGDGAGQAGALCGTQPPQLLRDGPLRPNRGRGAADHGRQRRPSAAAADRQRSGPEYLPLRVGVPIGAGGEQPTTSRSRSRSRRTPPSSRSPTDSSSAAARCSTSGSIGLRRVAGDRPRALDDLLTTLVTELPVDGHEDDTAILAVRWSALRAAPRPRRTSAPRPQASLVRLSGSPASVLPSCSSRDPAVASALRGDRAVGRVRRAQLRCGRAIGDAARPRRARAGGGPQRSRCPSQARPRSPRCRPARRARSPASASGHAPRARAGGRAGAFAAPAGARRASPCRRRREARRRRLDGRLAEAITLLAQPSPRIVQRLLDAVASRVGVAARRRIMSLTSCTETIAGHPPRRLRPVAVRPRRACALPPHHAYPAAVHANRERAGRAGARAPPPCLASRARGGRARGGRAEEARAILAGATPARATLTAAAERHDGEQISGRASTRDDAPLADGASTELLVEAGAVLAGLARAGRHDAPGRVADRPAPR